MSKYVLRETALDILARVGESGGYSHLLINQAIEKQTLGEKDVGLLTEIVYGTLQRRDTLDFYLIPFINKQKKLKPWVKWLLFMSVYQMKYLNKVPDHAVIHEAVEIAKQRGHKGIASLVNGVLRNIQRKGLPSFHQIDDEVERLAIETSHPKWLVKRWTEMYGPEITKEMCEQNLERSKMTVRVQPLKMTRDEVKAVLEEDGFEVELSNLSSQGLIIHRGNILKHTLFKDGILTVQDQSSMLVAEMMDLKPDMKVLDACSAPGGKTTHIAEKMENIGTIFAYDLHEKKVQLVRQKANQLGLSIIQAKQADSRMLFKYHKHESFDRILLDAPCSGLGILRGKPDIKYHKSEKDIMTLSTVQSELIAAIAPLLKKGGKLLYSTCTVDKNENDHLIKDFLRKHKDFEVDPTFKSDLPEVASSLPGLTDFGLQLFPQDLDTDGFYLTRLQKKE